MARQLYVLQCVVSDGACTVMFEVAAMVLVCSSMVLVLLGAGTQYTWNCELELVIGCTVWCHDHLRGD